jgi:hypothetical protein
MTDPDSEGKKLTHPADPDPLHCKKNTANLLLRISTHLNSASDSESL